mgnify:CR=1 FL=1
MTEQPDGEELLEALLPIRGQLPADPEGLLSKIWSNLKEKISEEKHPRVIGIMAQDRFLQESLLE